MGTADRRVRRPGRPGRLIRLARLVRRSARQAADLVRRRGRSAVHRALRLTGAAVAAYLVAVWLLPAPRPLLAPLTALLIVQVTLFGTLADSLRRVVSVVAGVVLAVMFAAALGFSWWSLGLLIAASIIVGQLLRLGPHLLEVPISAMLVLGIGRAEVTAADRILETLVGAGVGVAVNVFVPPGDQTRPAGAAVERYTEEIADLLDRMATELAAGASAEQAARWVADARAISRHAVRVERALTYAQESRRLNPRAFGTVDTGVHLRSGLEALEHCAVAIRGMCRGLAEAAIDTPPEVDDVAELREAFSVLLHDLAAAVRAFGALVRAEGEADVGADVSDRALTEALDTLREARVRLTELLLVNPQDQPRRWQLHGALLTSVERVLRELDVEERARLRQRQRQEALDRRTRTVQAVDRLRATTRQVAERPRRRGEPTQGPRRE